MPREGGIRECFMPRAGHVFLIADYRFIELVTLAQTQIARYGSSKLAEAINSGKDPHRITASAITGRALDEVSQHDRFRAKAVNFGFPGGLGIKSFLSYAKSTYRITLTEDEAKSYRQAWLTTYPEMGRWLTSDDLTTLADNLGLTVDEVLDVFGVQREESRWVPIVVARVTAGQKKANGEPYSPATIKRTWNLLRRGRLPQEHAWRASVEIPSASLAAYLKTNNALTLTGRVRAACTYTQARNCPFQGLAGDGAKIALFELARAGYHTVAFVHDEVVLEVPERADGDYRRVVHDTRRLMVEAMREVCPDVNVSVEIYVGRRWSKSPRPGDVLWKE